MKTGSQVRNSSCKKHFKNKGGILLDLPGIRHLILLLQTTTILMLSITRVRQICHQLKKRRLTESLVNRTT